MGKYLVTCSIAVLILLLQTDVIVSVSRRGGSRPSGGRKPSRPSSHQPSRPVHHQPSKPVQNKPINNVPPPPPSHNRPVKPPAGYPQNPPPYPGHQPLNPAHPPPYQPQNPAHPPPYQPQNPARPPPYQPQNPAYPPPPPYPGRQPQNPGPPPPYQPQNPAHPPPYQPQNPAYPPLYQPQNPAHPPPPPYPGHQPLNPVQRPPYPGHQPQNPAYPPQNPAYPAQNPAYPPHNPAVPPGNRPQNPAYPPQNPGNQPHNPGNFPVQPGFVPNPGYPNHGGGSWGQFDSKPWKPKPPKTKLKHVAGAAIAGAAAGALGGYLVGSAMSNMRFRFNNPADELWWYENRNRYSDRVYYPSYSQPVPRDTFVRDCVNITVKEYVEPTGNQTEDDVESRVVTQVVREMCIEQYRTYSSHGGGEGGFSRFDEKPEERRPIKPETKPGEGEALVKDHGGQLLGSAFLRKNFQFNDTSEKQWWDDNGHRFGYQVFFPNYSQPVSLETFMGDCENVTTKEYLRASGNETDNEVATRALTQVAHEMCTELYHGFSSRAEGGHGDNAPPEPMPTKLAMHNWPGPARPANVVEAGKGMPGHAVPMLGSHSVLLIIAGLLSFVIP